MSKKHKDEEATPQAVMGTGTLGEGTPVEVEEQPAQVTPIEKDNDGKKDDK